MAVVDAVFHHVSVAKGAGEVQVGASRFDFAQLKLTVGRRLAPCRKLGLSGKARL